MFKERVANHRLPLGAFALVNGTVSIALMALAARVSHQPLVFPSLGPTAFLIFYRPHVEASCPRNALIGHLIGALAGLGALAAFGLIDQGPALSHLSSARIGAAATSLGLTAGVMIWAGTPHPPAGATTLIVSLGFLHTPAAVGVLMLGVVLLVGQGIVVNRLAGIDYPIWGPRRPTRPIPIVAGRRTGPTGGDHAMFYTVFVDATGDSPASSDKFDRLRAMLADEAQEFTIRPREWTGMFTVEASDIDEAAELVRCHVVDAETAAGLPDWHFNCWEVRETLRRLDDEVPPWHPHRPHMHLHRPHLHVHRPHLRRPGPEMATRR